MSLSRLVLFSFLLSACGGSRDRDGDGFVRELDCNDENENINPDAEEVCDGIDNDCDDEVDEGVASTWYADADADTYGDPVVSTEACVQPDGYVANLDDCDDSDAAFHPGADESDCDDPNDYNCDGSSWAPDRATQEVHVYLIYGGITAGEYSAEEAAEAIFQGESEGDRLGVIGTMAILGDVDGDGAGDIMLGAHNRDSESGAAYLALGPHTGTVVASDTDVVLYPAIGDYLGRAVASAGDMNSDGFDDILVGAPRDDTGASDSGAVYLIYGGSTITSLDGSDADAVYDAVIAGNSTDLQIGEEIESGRDFDGDTNHDVLLGATSYGSISEGAAFFYYGPITGSLSLDDADATLTGTNNSDDAGSNLLIIEDLDGSGMGALLIDAAGSDAVDGSSAAGGAFLIDELSL